MSRAVLIALVAVGCGSRSTATTPVPAPGTAAPPVDAAPIVVIDAPPPPPLDRDLPRLAERSLALYQAIVAVFRAAGEDCAGAATKLAELRTAYADVTAANYKVHQEGRERELKAALAKYDDELDAAAREIVGSPTMAKCSRDGAFTRAFDELVGASP